MKIFRTQQDRDWSIVLAGGDGERLRPFIQRWLGQPKPKQYCTFTGTRSMLQHTLDRVDRLTAPARRVLVCARAHQREVLMQLHGRPPGTLILQPANRGTAAGIFLAVAYIRARDPEATVAIYPSDHFIYPENRFLEVLQRAVWGAENLTDRLVLLGASPNGPELEYGWVLPGCHLGWTMGRGMRAVQAFHEKPDIAKAYEAWAAGALWNTMIMVAKAETIWTLGWRSLPDMMPLYERIVEAIGTPQRRAVMDDVYQALPTRDFSSDVLQKAPDQLAVTELCDVTWSDWGRAERIVETLRQVGKHPAFPLESVTAGLHVGTDARELFREAAHVSLQVDYAQTPPRLRRRPATTCPKYLVGQRSPTGGLTNTLLKHHLSLG